MQKIKEKEGSVIKLQALVRGHQQRCALALKQELIAQHTPAIIAFQAYIRGYLQRRLMENRRAHYVARQRDVMKIQALFRTRKAVHAYQSLRTSNEFFT